MLTENSDKHGLALLLHSSAKQAMELACISYWENKHADSQRLPDCILCRDLSVNAIGRDGSPEKLESYIKAVHSASCVLVRRSQSTL